MPPHPQHTNFNSAERFIAVDWSGAKSPAEQRRRIVVAEWHAGKVAVSAGRTRAETTAWLIERARQTPQMVVGLDFSFSFPAWFVQQCGAATVEAFWQTADNQAELWLQQCQAPLWGRPFRRCPADHRGPHWRGYRLCERALSIGRPSSTFQIGGAGAVGTGSLRGLATLRALRAAGFSVWPFHSPALPCVLEIYPRTFTGPVVKSDPLARAAWLREHRSEEIPGAARSAAEASEDAFDAVCSAVGLASQHAEISALQQATDAITLLEGAIFPGRPIRNK